MSGERQPDRYDSTGLPAEDGPLGNNKTGAEDLARLAEEYPQKMQELGEQSDNES